MGKHSVEAQHDSSPQQAPLGTAGNVMHSHLGGGGSRHPLISLVMIAICVTKYYVIFLCKVFSTVFILILNPQKYDQNFDGAGSLHVSALKYELSLY